MVSSLTREPHAQVLPEVLGLELSHDSISILREVRARALLDAIESCIAPS